VAISVHSPIAEQRAELMPVERAYPLKSVIELLRDYDFAHQRRLSVEYIMWNGVNDSLRYAQSLSRLLKGLDCRVNLIRFHAIPDSPLATSPDERMIAFRDRLNELGITATIRTSRCEDIAAACGMLAGKQKSQDKCS
jgi:23S rRNA (adenine2503-C2)-methyltransferase